MCSSASFKPADAADWRLPERDLSCSASALAANMRRFPAIANYQHSMPSHRAKVNAAFRGLLAVVLYLSYEPHAQGWRKVLGIFMAVEQVRRLLGIEVGNGAGR